MVSTATVDSVTLTATDVNSHQESQTYYFEVPAGSIGGNTGTAVLADLALARYRQPRCGVVEQRRRQRRCQLGCAGYHALAAEL